MLLVDGRLAPDGLVRLDPEDPGLLWGVTVFETLRVRRGGIRSLGAHLSRLRRSAALLDLACPVPTSLQAWCWTAQAALGVPEAVIRITLTAGGTALVLARPAPRRRTAVRCVRVPVPRFFGRLAAAKHGNRLAGLRMVAAHPDVDEVLWTDAEGRLMEGTWSNVVGVEDGLVVTHPDDGQILGGITRAAVLALAKAQGIPTELRAVDPDRCTELYVTSSVHGMVPVVALDGQDRPGRGPLGDALDRLLWDPPAG